MDILDTSGRHFEDNIFHLLVSFLGRALAEHGRTAESCTAPSLPGLWLHLSEHFPEALLPVDADVLLTYAARDEWSVAEENPWVLNGLKI